MNLDLNIFNDKSILITGGGGYLGSKLAKVLSKSNATIRLLDIRFNQISNSLALYNSNIELYEIDLTDKDALMQFCQKIKPDYIFHFAAILNRDRDFEIYKKMYTVNVDSTFNLLEALKGINYKGFYFASTSEVYGTRNQLPFHEELLPNPVSPYSLTKYMAECLIRTYSSLYNKPYTILRLFNFFGPNMPENTFIGQMLAHYRDKQTFIMTKGEQKRDLTYIDELIDQVLFLAKTDHHLYDTFNICSNNSYSMIEIVKLFKEITNNDFNFETSLEYRENEVWEMTGSNKRIQSLNYCPNSILNNDLRNTLIRTLQM